MTLRRSHPTYTIPLYMLKRTLFSCGALLLAALLLPDAALAQDLHPSRRASPLGMARTFVGDTYVKVTYSRPYKRGRDNIFGEGEDVMHPYGEVWRFGANEPTEITVSGPVMIGDQMLEAGTYSLFATPGPSAWKLHVNDLRGGGANEYDAANDLVVVEAEVREPEEGEIDQFTIAFEEADEGAHMVVSWLDVEFTVLVMPGDNVGRETSR